MFGHYSFPMSSILLNDVVLKGGLANDLLRERKTPFGVKYYSTKKPRNISILYIHVVHLTLRMVLNWSIKKA